MERENLDLLVIFSGKPESGYVRYFTGYEPQLGILDCCFLVVVPGAAKSWTLITNAFWDEPFGTWHLQEAIVTSHFPEEIQQLVPSWVRRAGIAPYRSFPAPVYVALEKKLRAGTIIDATGNLLWLRAIKSPAEIEVLQRVAAIADSSAEALLQSCSEGTSELDIAAQVEYALRPKWNTHYAGPVRDRSFSRRSFAPVPEPLTLLLCRVNAGYELGTWFNWIAALP
jgi:Xaa-Pro aminopeptidase